MLKVRLSAIVIAVLAVIFVGGENFALAQGQATTTDKVDPPVKSGPYRAVKDIAKPQKWDSADQKVELLYLFWYGCPTCQMIDEMVSEMGATLPPGIRLTKLPAVFDVNNEWGVHAKLFWALENLGLEKDLHTKVFLAVQGAPGGGHGPLQLLSIDSQKTFAKANKVNVKDFEATLNSPLVENQLRKTASYLEAVDLGSVPSFIVNGKYIVSIEGRRPITDFINEAARLAQKELDEAAKAPAAKAPEAKAPSTKVPETQTPAAPAPSPAPNPAQ
ncbi:MAG: thiol:disulfide interchange protein DsbA/DsbL [Deltaproteobacteria bacterium]|jgi:thiol:disulfide interchange protein DsbA|nr:thiol:disulfide interchange protein DsbA/DsbL [Deltaproteobacteria bacterium]